MPHTKPKVLIVDDQEGIRESLKLILSDSYELILTDSGTQALEMLDKDNTIGLVLLDIKMPQISGLVLISPSIGITPMAAIANWQAKLGRLLGLSKLAWNAILPEYDPFKYNSFAVNASDQVYRLTTEIPPPQRNRTEQCRQQRQQIKAP